MPAQPSAASARTVKFSDATIEKRRAAFGAFNGGKLDSIPVGEIETMVRWIGQNPTPAG